MAAAAAVITVPGYGRAGSVARRVGPGAWTSIAGQMHVARSGLLDGALWSRTSVLGR